MYCSVVFMHLLHSFHKSHPNTEFHHLFCCLCCQILPVLYLKQDGIIEAHSFQGHGCSNVGFDVGRMDDRGEEMRWL